MFHKIAEMPQGIVANEFEDGVPVSKGRRLIQIVSDTFRPSFLDTARLHVDRKIPFFSSKRQEKEKLLIGPFVRLQPVDSFRYYFLILLEIRHRSQ